MELQIDTGQMIKPDERYLRIARELAVGAHCRYCDHTSVARTKCAADVEDSARQFALAIERAAVEGAIESVSQCCMKGGLWRINHLAALRKRLEELGK